MYTSCITADTLHKEAAQELVRTRLKEFSIFDDHLVQHFFSVSDSPVDVLAAWHICHIWDIPRAGRSCL